MLNNLTLDFLYRALISIFFFSSNTVSKANLLVKNSLFASLKSIFINLVIKILLVSKLDVNKIHPELSFKNTYV